MSILKKILYELYKGRRPSHIKVFGCKCFILKNGKEKLGIFKAKVHEGIFVVYVSNSHAYRIYNKRFMVVEEFFHVVFDESNSKLQDQVSIDANEEDVIREK